MTVKPPPIPPRRAATVPGAATHSGLTVPGVSGVRKLPGGKPGRVLVVESSRGALKKALELVEGMGLTGVPVDEGPDAEKQAETGVFDAVIVGMPGGEDVVRAAMARGLDRPSVIITIAPSDRKPAEAASAASVDTAVVRPLKRETLAIALRSCMLLRKQRRRIADLERKLVEERRSRAATGGVDPRTGFYPFDTFKRMLEMELKRAKRYEYSLAAVLVSLDPPHIADDPTSKVELRPDARNALGTALAAAVSDCIRDIDLPVDYADGRFLVFLPYTDLDGAERVGHRIIEKIRRGVFKDGERTLQISASVGVASQRPGEPVRFAQLIRDALTALKAARLKGGNRVVVREAPAREVVDVG
jgi:diguanylate cyclase (GGDEF)-like protein